MKLAHATMGLCLAGLGLPAMAELTPNCTTVAESAAMPPAGTASVCDERAADRVRAPAHEAAQLRLYDAAAAVPPHAATSRRPAGAAPQALNASQRRVLALAPSVDDVARTYDIDPLLLHAIAHVESRHDPHARSPAGALGVLQVMPATAHRFGVDGAPAALFDPAVNLQVGAAYLKTLQARFGNDLPLVLAAYNAGENAVERHGRSVPPYAETRSYVRQVLAEYGALRAALGRSSQGEPR